MGKKGLSMRSLLVLCIIKFASQIIAVSMWAFAIINGGMDILRILSICLLLADSMIGLLIFRFLMGRGRTEPEALKLNGNIFGACFVIDAIIVALMGPWNCNVPRSKMLYYEAISVLMLISSDSICSIAGQIYELRRRKKPGI